jgi:hypothetical protein
MAKVICAFLWGARLGVADVIHHFGQAKNSVVESLQIVFVIYGLVLDWETNLVGELGYIGDSP